MATIKISLLLSIVIALSSPFFIFTQESSSLNNTSASNWLTVYCQKMNPQELQVTANIIYLLYTNALIDSKIQELYSPIYRLTQVVLINSNDPFNPNHELTTLGAQIEKLSYMTQTRFVYTQILNACLDYYNHNKTEIVDETLKALQSHAQDFLRIWADDNSKNFITDFKISTNIMAKNAQYFHAASNLHKGLLNGHLPFSVEEKNKSLAIIDTVVKSIPNFINASDKMVNALHKTTDQAMKIICIGTEIYKQYYEVIHAMITSDSYSKNYATTLFSLDGLLPEEHKSLLPNASHVFEHMHKTTMLYTPVQL